MTRLPRQVLPVFSLDRAFITTSFRIGWHEGSGDQEKDERNKKGCESDFVLDDSE